MKLTAFEVNKPFPAPFPINEGTIMELWWSGLVVIIQMPNLAKKELQAFKKSFNSYSYFESKTPVPIPVWVFDFPKPHGQIEVNFNARIVNAAILSPYLDNSEGIKNALTFYLLDGAILRAQKLVGLHEEAIEAFQQTIKKQMNLNFNLQEYNRYLNGLFAYSSDELFTTGKVYSFR